MMNLSTNRNKAILLDVKLYGWLSYIPGVTLYFVEASLGSSVTPMNFAAYCSQRALTLHVYIRFFAFD